MADPKDQTPAEPVAGGPGVEPTAEAPKLVTVKHGGREMQVPEDVANVWTEREREFEQRFSRQGAELGDLRKKWQSVESTVVQPATPAKPADDINTLWFENPQAAYQKIVKDVRQEIVTDYRRDQALQRFWDGFYRANDDLREDGWVAEATFNENFDTLADLPTAKAQEALAELTRTKILRLTRKGGASQKAPAAVLEPASGDRPARPAAPEDEGPPSISALITARRAARMAGRKGG